MTILKIFPSILSADFAEIGSAVRAAEHGGADGLHVDVMDGMFVPNITIGPPVLAAIRAVTTLHLDTHLMIEDPDRFLEIFAKSGADGITVHAEACTHLHRTIHAIKNLGKRAGVAINPATPLASVEEVIRDIDVLLLMSVNPGFGGQLFIEHSLDKLRRCAKLIEESGSSTDLEVDGGVDAKNAAAITRAGARILVAGSAVFGHPDGVTRAIEEIRSAANSGLGL